MDQPRTRKLEIFLEMAPLLPTVADVCETCQSWKMGRASLGLNPQNSIHKDFNWFRKDCNSFNEDCNSFRQTCYEIRIVLWLSPRPTQSTAEFFCKLIVGGRVIAPPSLRPDNGPGERQISFFFKLQFHWFIVIYRFMDFLTGGDKFDK